MEIILREDVAGLGKAGQQVKVKDGYARNFLIPQKKAVLADPKNIRQLEHNKRMGEARQKKLTKVTQELASKLSGMSITIAREAGAEEKLFGSVTTKDIADALRHDGVVIDKRTIMLKEPIKQIGVFDIEVKLHPEVSGLIKVWVVKK
jgi:large subunit ribosomal protein L9